MAGNSQQFQISSPPSYEINSEIQRQYRYFNTMGTEVTVKTLAPPNPDGTDPMSYFIDTNNEILERT
jgi:hypothetical protein